MEEKTSRILKGPYLILLTVALFIQTANSSLIGQILSFFSVEPIAACEENYYDKEKRKCDIKAMCDAGANIVISNIETLKNWSTSLKLYCPSTTFQMIARMIHFIGSGVFPLFISHLPDKFGRIMGLNIEMFIMLVGCILMLVSNKVVLCIGLFITGGMIQIYTLCSQIVAEFFHISIRGIIVGILMAAIPILAIIYILIFYFVRKTSIFWWSLLITQALSILLVNVYYIESPIFLINSGQKEKCLYYLKKAAKMNGTMAEYLEFEKEIDIYIPEKYKKVPSDKKEGENKEEGDQMVGVQNKEEEKVNYNIKHVFKFKSVRRLVLLIWPYWTAVLLFDFTVFLNLDKSGDDIYLHGITVFIACVVAAFASGILADISGRKICMYFSIILSVVAYIFTPLCNKKGQRALETILLFISCFSIEFGFTIVVVYSGEVFPLPIKSTAYGILYTLSRIGAIVSPYTVGLLKYPQYLVCALLLATTVCVFPLEETKGREVITEIPEVEEMKKAGENEGDKEPKEQKVDEV